MVPPPDIAVSDEATDTPGPTEATAPDAIARLDSAPQQLVAGMLGRADIRIDGDRPRRLRA